MALSWSDLMRLLGCLRTADGVETGRVRGQRILQRLPGELTSKVDRTRTREQPPLHHAEDGLVAVHTRHAEVRHVAVGAQSASGSAVTHNRANPSTCSTNVACRQARSRQRNRRTCNSITTGRPAIAVSARRRAYRLCTGPTPSRRPDMRPAPPMHGPARPPTRRRPPCFRSIRLRPGGTTGPGGTHHPRPFMRKGRTSGPGIESDPEPLFSRRRQMTALSCSDA